MMSSRTAMPVGIFDSGVGGLTVLKEIMERLPDEDLVYFGDTAHLPYGNKSSETVIRYSSRIADFLIDKGVKMLVIACNTASVYALQVLEDRYDIPVLGVVTSGAGAAVNTAGSAIAVIGTQGTVNSRAYEKLIRAAKPDLTLYSVACPLFVPLVEEGWLDHPVTESIAQIYLGCLSGKIDSIILGCTHYPMIKGVISGVLGPAVAIIDSATEVAKSANKMLENLDIRRSSNKSRTVKYYVSDSPDNFIKLGRVFLGKSIEERC